MIDNLMSFDEFQEDSFDKTPYFGYVYLTYCEPEDKFYLGKKISQLFKNSKTR